MFEFNDINLLYIINLILVIAVIYLLFFKEDKEHFTTEDDIKNAVNELYQADIGAIRNLGQISKDIMTNKDNLTLPTNITIPGDLTVNWLSTTTDVNVGRGLKVPNGKIDFLPKGSIIAFYGSPFPPGWAICDGTNDTPDLRSRFIIGATLGNKEPDKLPNGLTSRNFGGNGGEEAHVLDIKEIPPHNHRFRQYQWGGGDEYIQGPDNNGDNMGWKTTENTGGEDGVTKAHNNLPPYFALYYIMRII